MALVYLRGYLSVFLRYGDHAAAKRSAALNVLFARKRRERQRALRGF